MDLWKRSTQVQKDMDGLIDGFVEKEHPGTEYRDTAHPGAEYRDNLIDGLVQNGAHIHRRQGFFLSVEH